MDVRAHGKHSLEHVSSIYSINTSLELKLTSKERMKDRGSTLSEWKAWADKNKDLLSHPCAYESNFVLHILAKVPGLRTSDVIPQYEFVDKAGRNRRIDFVIINESKGWGLAIELDGLTKFDRSMDFENLEHKTDYELFDDFLYRQNSLLSENADRIHMLFRYSNKRFFKHGDMVVNEISEELERQKKKPARELETFTIVDSMNRKAATTCPIDEPSRAVSENAACRSDSMKFQAQRNPLSKKSKIFLLIACVVLFGLVFANLARNKSEQDFSSVPKTMATKSTVSNQTHNVNDASTDASVNSLNLRIPSGQAGANLGRNAEVCGKLAQIVLKDHTVYLNFEKPFPYNDFTAVIKNIDSNELIEFDEKIGKPLCVTGVIRLFGKKPGMFITKHF